MITDIHSRYCEMVRLLLLLCAVLPCALSAEQNPESSEADQRAIPQSVKAIAPWLLNSDEGLAIIGAALESRHTDSNADCSSLVHAIYERAGFAYSYANSSQLYRGIKAFRRVTHLQPGDLVVWRGHVGIVISPVQHSFFSVMRSGRGVEFYDSPYWEARGQPRFFRYLRAGPSTLFSASTRSGGAESPDSVPADEDSGPVPAVSGRSSARTSTLGPNVDESAAAPSAQTLSHAPTIGTTPPAALSGTDGTQGESRQNAEQQTAREAQGPMDRNQQTPVSHNTQSLREGVWEKTATKPSAGIPFNSTATPARLYVPRPPPGFWASSTAARKRSRSSRNPERM